MFESIFDAAGATPVQLLICTGISLLCGAIIAGVYCIDKKHTKSLAIALLILPPIVQAIIMMVNGNLGVGVAVMGAFSLIRFRSVPGSAKDITLIFLAMAAGLSGGTGFPYFGLVFTVILGIIFLIMSKVFNFTGVPTERQLKVTIPEDLDYTEIFDDIFKNYTSYNDLIRVKTVNMGTLFELQYKIRLKDVKNEKKMIDEIRCRNGNLTVISSRLPDNDNAI